jgi:hypothetical protein
VRPAPAQPLAPVVPEAPVAPAPPVAPAKAPTRGGWRATLSILLLLGLSGLLFVNWVQGVQEVDRLKEERGRLQYTEQAAQQDLQRLTRQRDEALGQASQSRQGAQALQARNQQVEQELQQSAQRVDALQKLQEQSLKFMDHVLLDTSIRNALSVHRVVRLCNQTDAPVAYRVMNENLRWSEQREIEPQDCDAYAMHGSQPRVPVMYSTVKDGIALQGEAMAGIVMGRLPDTEADWKPWENQLLTGPDGNLQLESTYQGLPSLGSALQQP